MVDQARVVLVDHPLALGGNQRQDRHAEAVRLVHDGPEVREHPVLEFVGDIDHDRHHVRADAQRLGRAAHEASGVGRQAVARAAGELGHGRGEKRHVGQVRPQRPLVEHDALDGKFADHGDKARQFLQAA